MGGEAWLEQRLEGGRRGGGWVAPKDTGSAVKPGLNHDAPRF